MSGIWYWDPSAIKVTVCMSYQFYKFRFSRSCFILPVCLLSICITVSKYICIFIHLNMHICIQRDVDLFLVSLSGHRAFLGDVFGLVPHTIFTISCGKLLLGLHSPCSLHSEKLLMLLLFLGVHWSRFIWPSDSFPWHLVDVMNDVLSVWFKRICSKI